MSASSRGQAPSASSRGQAESASSRGQAESASKGGAPGLLDPRVLAGLANLELVARAVVDGFMVGLHRSLRPGFSLEFADYRPYEPGDDPRFIDWNAYARSDRLVMKRYVGETSTHLMIVLDASASMGIRGRGAVSKLQYAKYTAASLAYLAHRQHDPLGWAIFDAQLREYAPPQSRRNPLGSFLHALERTAPGGATDAAAALGPFARRVNRRGLVALISDFLCEPEPLLESVRPLAARGQELLLLQVLDPADLDPLLEGGELLEDSETGETMAVSPEFARHEYPERMARHVAALARAARESGADHVTLDTSAPLDRALRSYLSFRRGRRR
jgi:uncharacterized protein (DUF58 family)